MTYWSAIEKRGGTWRLHYTALSADSRVAKSIDADHVIVAGGSLGSTEVVMTQTDTRRDRRVAGPQAPFVFAWRDNVQRNETSKRRSAKSRVARRPSCADRHAGTLVAEIDGIDR